MKAINANGIFRRVFAATFMAAFFATILFLYNFPQSVKTSDGFRRLEGKGTEEVMLGNIIGNGAIGARANIFPVKPIDFDLLYPQEIGVGSESILSTKSVEAKNKKKAPTFVPTKMPSKSPSKFPSSFNPTKQPTTNPTLASIPTVEPTLQPTLDPTISFAPTETPTEKPTISPTFEPTLTPTSPTSEPTTVPTKLPTFSPSVRPTLAPSAFPSKSPARYPTFAPANDIIYHSPGPVMLGTVKVYHIYYGDFSSTSGQATVSLMNYFASNIGSSDWYNIMTTYYDYTGTYCSASVTYGGSVYLATTTTSGTVTATTVQSNIKKAISDGSFPLDPNGVYFFIFRGSITYSGFLTSWCGFHSYFYYNGVALKYSVLGDPSTATSRGSGCEAITSNTANGNVGADSMASVYAHELVEAVSDPLLNAWYFSSGYENADECSWTFGSKLPGSTNANIYVGTKTWYIQRNWQPKYGCVLAKV